MIQISSREAENIIKQGGLFFIDINGNQHVIFGGVSLIVSYANTIYEQEKSNEINSTG